MSRIVRWLHLSDFHVGKDDYVTRKMFDNIIEHVAGRPHKPDLLFITGDIANSGMASEYETFWTDFAWPLQDKLGADSEHRTFIVPGNHDVNRKVFQAFGREEINDPKSHYFDPTAEGKQLREMLLPRFKEFLEQDCTDSKGAFKTEDGAYSKLMDISGVKVGIAGINTAWLCKDEKDEKNLTPGKPLLDHALDAIKGAALRIVLGHHPLDWLVPDELKAIKSRLGKSAALYLHGHLHKEWAEPGYGGGHEFLTIQSGAAFQAREGEIWRNGLVWGEADMDANVVRLQPWRWNPDYQEWSLAADAYAEIHREGDWWVYQLPKVAVARHSSSPVVSKPLPLPTKGWLVTTAEELDRHLGPLPVGTAIPYFNGAIPDWHTALSTSIPRRQIVSTLAECFRDGDTATRPLVTLFLAPACEGKTTALLQAVHQIVAAKPHWRVLYRSDDAELLNPKEILSLLGKADHWLIVIDEADSVAPDVVKLIGKLPAHLQGRVHFLMACRDSDWNASEAWKINWANLSTFTIERMAGLESDDAEAIVNAWAEFGVVGLGDLAAVPPEERAEILQQRVHEEANNSHGAFFGALLAVRQGSGLKDHARRMLESLGHRKVSPGVTLKDALVYVAAMDAEGLEFLSRPVLARVLRCPLDKLHRAVIAPLGEEAAATTTSSYIFTRHRRIAKAIISVVESEFRIDVSEMFLNLGDAAIDAALAQDFVPGLADWRSKFATHFQKERPELAVRIAQSMLSHEPSNYMSLINAAHIFMGASAAGKAMQLFRQFPKNVRTDRRFFHVWGLAESANKNYATSCLLFAYSMSDGDHRVQVNNATAVKGLRGLSDNFNSLFHDYHEIAFRDAWGAAATLALKLPLKPQDSASFQDDLEKAYASGSKQFTLDEAIAALRTGVIAAEKVGVEPDVASALPEATGFEFDGLQKLVAGASVVVAARR